MTRRVPAVLLAALAVAAVLGAVFAAGLYCSDDTRYLIGLQKIVDGLPIDPASSAERRLVFLLPFAIVLQATGALAPLFALAVLAYVALVAASYACARLVLSRELAGFVALLVAVHPLLYVFAGALLPDVAFSLAAVGALGAVLAWETRGRRLRSLAWAGAFAGLSITVKESGVVYPPLVLALVAALGPGPTRAGALREVARGSAAFLGGVVLVLAIEAALFAFFAGRPHSSLASAGHPPGFAFELARQGVWPWERLGTLALALRRFVPWTFALPLIAFVPLFRAGEAPARRRVLVILLAFTFGPLLAFIFAPTSLRAYVPPPIQSRYYAPVVAPAALSVAVAVESLVRGRRRATLVLAGLALAVAVQGLATSFPQRRRIYAAVHAMAWHHARADLAARFPGVPVLDAPGGHDDHARCRKILAAFPTSSRDLLEGRLRYASELPDEPFLVLGPPGFLELDHPFSKRLRAERRGREEAGARVGAWDAAPRTPGAHVLALEAFLFTDGSPQASEAPRRR